MKNKEKTKIEKRLRRKARTRAKIFGTAKIPRLSVFRSLKHISAQLIDDEKSRTLVAASDKELQKREAGSGKREKETDKNRTTKIATAFEVGQLLAEKAKAKKIKKCVFDKGCYKYHGRVKAVAEGARNSGLKF